MKFYGYCEDTTLGEEGPVKLREVTLCADPKTLRTLSEFLLAAAEAMEKHGTAFGHEHFEDFDHSRPASPAFIVTRDT